MPFSVVPLPFKPSRMNGLSKKLLLSHYVNNYGGAVRRLNTIERVLAETPFKTTPGFVINGLKREEIIATNSMILHEAYFDCLGDSLADDLRPEGALAAALEQSFGSVGRWQQEFTAIAKAQAGGSGWAVLAYSPRHRRLVNQWAADHTHAIVASWPVLALDMYEHAYHLDFGARAPEYVDTVMRNIHWPRVAAAYDRAVAAAQAAEAGPSSSSAPRIGAEELQTLLAQHSDLQLVDVRLQPDFEESDAVVAGAIRCPPEGVGEWSAALSPGRPVVVYCAYGFEVGQGVAAALRERGLDARYLSGGIAAWQAIGAPTSPKAEATGADRP